MYGVVLLIVFIAVAAPEGRTSIEDCREREIEIGVLAMDRATEVREGEGGARRWVGSKGVQGTRNHHTLWIGVLYAVTIVAVLAVVARLF
jgi:hypothetical protein